MTSHVHPDLPGQLLLIAPRIVTLDPSVPTATALAVTRGRVVGYAGPSGLPEPHVRASCGMQPTSLRSRQGIRSHPLQRPGHAARSPREYPDRGGTSYEFGRILGPGQAIPPIAALKGDTLWAAYLGRREAEVGSLRPGCFADAVVLPDHIGKIATQRPTVSAVFVSGQEVV